MADDFLYNQEVTAEDLNNIAVDLGLSDYSYFTENSPYAVSALNQITMDLTGKGILQIGNMCKVTTAENSAVVLNGVCVFETGAKTRISGTKSVSLIPGSTNYIYFLNDHSNNRISLVSSLSEPVSGDYVMLAEISSDGTVTDRREYSISKTTIGTNLSIEMNVDIFFESGEYHETELDFGYSGFNLIYYKDYAGNSDYDRYTEIKDGDDEKLIYTRGFGNHRLYAQKRGSKLILKSYVGGSGSEGTRTITLKVY